MGGGSTYTPEVRAKAQTLYLNGSSRTEISAALQVNLSTLSNWFQPSGGFSERTRVDRSPDPRPLARCRMELEAARAAGVKFADAWAAAIAAAPASWRETLDETRSAWRDAYDGEGRAGRRCWPVSRIAGSLSLSGEPPGDDLVVPGDGAVVVSVRLRGARVLRGAP